MNERDSESLAAIRNVVEDWVIFRDGGFYDRLLDLWHDDGRMMTTWAQVSAVDFVARSREAFGRGAMIQHFLGGSHVDIVGQRAIAQTKTTITQRGEVEGVLCDATCFGRFYDFFECRQGQWKLALRQPIYERDRLDPVTPGALPQLDLALLGSFPDGYRHLAYMQAGLGMVVKTDMPGLRGPEVEALYARGEAWLAGR
ncbi:nuclear transport factor 2 family protein [Novosphingobium terrae]|uniref:nuclear transport factor 2 family protein n=1 Tax=Novosphingobium terrae TaxID=2726189 RepID=UPI00197E32A9|nr:nuclear transport factor 2 family protein [Novosphingobium terrae]